MSLNICMILTWASDPQLISSIRSSNLLIPNIRTLASSQASSPSSSVGSHHSTHSYQDTDTGDGQGEIQILARRILEFVDGDGDVGVPGSVTASHMQPGSSIGSSSGRGDDELRRSVREAFAPGSHR